MTKFEQRISNYMDAAFPVIYVHTFEEEKAKEAIQHASESVSSISILEWDGTDRICDPRTGEVKYDVSTYSLADILDDRMDYPARQILILRNLDTFLDEPSVMARLKKFAEHIHSGRLDATIFLLSPTLNIPKNFEKYITVVEMDYLQVEEIRAIIHDFTETQEIQISESLEKELATAFKGLSEFEIQNILQLAYSESGELTKAQVSLIFDPSVLSNMDAARQFGVDIPKGVLIAGVPGCGKSLSAKAAAKLFNIPLLRLDMGRLLGKYVGESEANMRKAIQLAEAISPCVLWIDELEKAFAGIGGDGSGAEVTTRLFGSFLTWLQEKESPAFVVATANDITKLPPELMRKGRFDEIFYVGLPQREERRKIFEIHIQKRRPQDLSKINVDALLDKTEGYSGADIEGVIRESVESAFAAQKTELATDDILQVIANTHSLSEIMKEPIQKMEKEYQNRKFKNASK